MKIRIATHDDHRMVVIQEVVKRFRKEYPGVNVILEMLPNKEMIKQQFLEGKGPDIAEWEGANIGQCLDLGLLSDITDLVNKTE